MHFLSIFLPLLLLSIGSATGATTIRICYESLPFPPYAMGTDKVPLNNKGLMIDHVIRIVNNAGLKPAFYRRPWLRCINDLIAGRSDAVFPIIWRQDRAGWGRFPTINGTVIDDSRALGKARYMIFVPVDSSIGFDGKHFSGLTSGIGAPFGYVVYQRLKQAGVLSPMDLNPQQGFKLLSTGSLDGYVMSELLAQLMINRNGWQKAIRKLPIAYHTATLHLLLSHPFYLSDPQQAETLWNEVKRLSADNPSETTKKGCARDPCGN